MPSLLTRSVLSEVLRWYAAGLALFLSLLITDALSTTVDKLITYHPPLWKAGAAFAAILPSILSKATVAAVPFAVLLAFSRMQRDNELKAVFASGIRPLSLVWPLALPFAAVAAFAFWNEGTLTPAGLKNWDKAWYDIYDQPLLPPTQEKYTYAPPGALYYAGRVQVTPGVAEAQLSGVLVQRGEDTLSAAQGTWNTTTHTWTLQSPWITRPGADPRQETGPLTLPQGDTLRPPLQDSKKVSNAELRASLTRPDLQPSQRREYEFQLARRVADPLTPVVFALAAGALGLLLRHRAAAFAAVVVFIASFYALWVTVPNLARAGAIDPLLAAWLPNVAFLLIAGALTWRLR